MARVIEGDCVEKMRELPAESIDAIVCDPPYAFPGGFMGRAWDRFDGREDVAFGYYMAGLIDGEGCFRVQRHKRGSHTCTFSMRLRLDDEAILRQAQRALKAGTLSNAEERGASKPCKSWVIQSKGDCEILVGFLRRFPLRAKKRAEFEVWADAVGEWVGRPRGNRWHGSADQSDAEALKGRIEGLRDYAEPAWSGHPFQDWVREWGREAHRVLKPGGHLLAMGAPRSYHRLAAGLEDAGFEIRDSLAHLFGSGFPKSHNLNGDWEGWGTALKPGHEPIVVGRKPLTGTVAKNVLEHGTGALNIDGCRVRMSDDDREIVDKRSGAGFGTIQCEHAGRDEGERFTSAPAGRWPANVLLSHLPECVEVGTRKVKVVGATAHQKHHGKGQMLNPGEGQAEHPGYRDPDGTETITAYECAEGCPVAALDEQSGERPVSGTAKLNKPLVAGGGGYHDIPGGVETNAPNDTGGASRFFKTTTEHRGEQNAGRPDTTPALDEGGAGSGTQDAPRIHPTAPSGAGAGGEAEGERFCYVAKASRAERNAGLDGFEATGRTLGHKRCAACGKQKVNVPGSECKCPEPREWVAVEDHSPRANSHPTVKPIDLMRWLVRLVTPPNGTVLDPFLGSGTTGCAAVLEGFDFIGIEREAEYVAIAEARIAWWAERAGQDTTEALIAAGLAERIQAEHDNRGQIGLFDEVDV